MNQDVKEFIKHISDKPWSDYSEADYSLEQWHNACLIHLHTGPPTSKTQCKLPIKTPAGVINKNGVSAALAALHGARAPLKAPPDQKAKAERRLQTLSAQFKTQKASSLEHHGIKGMRWGVRRGRNASGKPTRGTSRTVFEKHPKHLTSAELEARIRRMEAEKKYNELNKRDVSRGEQLAGEILKNSGRAVATTVLTGALLLGVKTAVGKKMGSEAASMITKRK
jgi:hypothetical protein